LTPSIESHCITSHKLRKKVSKDGLKYLILCVIYCMKRLMLTPYSDGMTKKCWFDSWQRQEVFHVSRLVRLALGSSYPSVQHDHPLPCNAEVESEWSSTSTPSSLHGMSLIFMYGQLYLLTGYGKAIPLQASTGPEGSRRLRLPDLKTIGT
jgi:hypothetical protein